MMTALAEKSKAATTINMRVKPRLRDMIDRAAAIQGKSRSEFVLESARERAVEVMLDQRYFELDAEDSAALAKMLSEPAKRCDELRRLINSKAPWE